MVMVYRVVLFLGRGEILSKIGDLITTESVRDEFVALLRSGAFKPCIRAGFLFKGLKENDAAVIFWHPAAVKGALS